MTRSAATMEDQALLAAFRAGRTVAFEAIVRRHYRGLLRVAEQRCGSSALAEDAVQNGLVRAHRYLRNGNGTIENPGAWLRRVVYNCATDLLQTERRDRAGLDLAAHVAAPDEHGPERRELEQLVREGIARLPALYREPLVLRYLRGLEAREIAAQLGHNLNSVKSRLARGRRELRRRLEPALARAGYLP